nr:6017_t:CDS:10 [Entrophospora candida]
MDNNNQAINNSFTSRPQQWKKLQEIVCTVNSDAREKLLTFMHKVSSDGGEVDHRKTFIKNYLMPQRQVYLKLFSLVKWSENTEILRDCELYYRNLQNQKETINNLVRSFQHLADFVPQSSLRAPDIWTAIDVLTTGTYQQFPTIIKELHAPEYLSDKAVKEVLENLNSVINLRILTEEIIPEPMRKYKVADGRIKFHVDKEFEVVLTPNDPLPDSLWFIVDLKLFIQSEADTLYHDIELSSHENQIAFLIDYAQKGCLNPPHTLLPEKSPSSLQVMSNGSQNESSQKPAKHLPLVKLYDCLHTFCLDLQLDVLAQQTHRLFFTRWSKNITFTVNEERTSLKISYWSAMTNMLSAQPNRHSNNASVQRPQTQNIIEIYITEDIPKHSLIHSSRKNLAKYHWMTNTSNLKPGILNYNNRLNYPIKYLQARWTGLTTIGDGDGDGAVGEKWELLDWEFNPADLNVEHLLLSVTQKHAEFIICNFMEETLGKDLFSHGDVEIVKIEKAFYEELNSEDASISDTKAKKYLKVPSLRVRLSENRYVFISVDIRSGRIIIEENNKSIDEEKIKMCEEKLSHVSSNVVEVLMMLKIMTMLFQIEKAAKYLQFDVHRGIILRKEDIAKLGTNQIQILYLKFQEYSNYYLICGIVDGKLKYWLTTLINVPSPTRYNIVQITRDATHKLGSIYPIQLDELLLDESKEKISLREEKDFLKLVKSNTNYSEDQKELMKSISQAHEGLEGEIILLAKVTALCRARISYLEIESQLKSHNLTFFSFKPKKISNFIDSNTVLSLSKIIPILKLSRSQLISKTPMAIDASFKIFDDVLIRFVGSRKQNSIDCLVVMCTQINTDFLPTISDNILFENVHYNHVSNVLSFRYSDKDLYIKSFLNDWQRIVMMCQAASQLSSQKWKNHSIVKFEPFDFKTFKVIYSKDYFVEISWKNNKYSLNFDVINKKEIRNPHRRISIFLQDILNTDCEVEPLITILLNTVKLLSALDILEFKNSSLKKGSSLVIVTRSYRHFRLIWSPRLLPFSTEPLVKYGLEVEIQKNNQIIIHDSGLSSSHLKSTKTLPLWKKIIETLINYDDNKDNGLTTNVNGIILLDNGFILPTDEIFENLINWLDNQIRNLTS